MLDPLWVKHGPVVRLLRAHRPAVHQRELIDAEHLTQQAVLRGYVVVVADRKRHAIAVAGRAGQAIAEHVHDQHEVTRRVENASGLDQPIDVVVVGAKGGRVEHGVRTVGQERAVAAIHELGVAQHDAALERERAELEDRRSRAHAGRSAAACFSMFLR
jgi:hypothetical protein